MLAAQRRDWRVLRNRIQTKPYHAKYWLPGRGCLWLNCRMLWLLQALRKRRYVAQIPPPRYETSGYGHVRQEPKDLQKVRKNGKDYTLVDVKLKAIYASPIGKAETATATHRDVEIILFG